MFRNDYKGFSSRWLCNFHHFSCQHRKYYLYIYQASMRKRCPKKLEKELVDKSNKVYMFLLACPSLLWLMPRAKLFLQFCFIFSLQPCHHDLRSWPHRALLWFECTQGTSLYKWPHSKIVECTILPQHNLTFWVLKTQRELCALCCGMHMKTHETFLASL